MYAYKHVLLASRVRWSDVGLSLDNYYLNLFITIVSLYNLLAQTRRMLYFIRYLMIKL